MDYDRIVEGQTDFVWGASKSHSAFLRLALPFGEKSSDGYTQAIVAEIKMSKLLALFSAKADTFSFMAGPWAQLVVASESGHFGATEDLSANAVIQAARRAPEIQGTLECSEIPDGEEQYASFHRIPSAGNAVVVTQIPHSRVTDALALSSKTQWHSEAHWRCSWAFSWIHCQTRKRHPDQQAAKREAPESKEPKEAKEPKELDEPQSTPCVPRGSLCTHSSTESTHWPQKWTPSESARCCAGFTAKPGTRSHPAEALHIRHIMARWRLSGRHRLI